jgi:hypothetical protein
MTNPTVDMLRARLDARRTRFLKWLSENPDVWLEFVNLSFTAINNGRKHYSAWLIVARITSIRSITGSTRHAL